MRGTEQKQIWTGPLMSWDVFMQGYRRTQQLSDDLTMLKKMAIEQQWQQQFDFEDHLFRQRTTIIVTSFSAQHIIFASSNIIGMNGYHPQEVIGKSPRMFQGAQTTTESKRVIRQAVEEHRPFVTELVNYRKNGNPYHCLVKGYPVFNKVKKLTNFIAFEKEIKMPVNSFNFS